MNKRIQELMPKAYELVRKRHNGYFDQDLLLTYMAELVIVDCIRAVENGGGMCGVTSSGKIKKHFGVEE